jgi:hypothetical protein
MIKEMLDQIKKNEHKGRFLAGIVSWLIKKHYPARHFIFTREMLKEMDGTTLMRRWKGDDCHYLVALNDEEIKSLEEKLDKAYPDKEKSKDEDSEKLHVLQEILENLKKLKKSL